MMNHIQNKFFFTQYVCTVYIYYVCIYIYIYIYIRLTHTTYIENVYIFTCIYLYSYKLYHI